LKRNKLLFNFLAVVVGIVIYKIIDMSISQPGLKQWEGKYEELGYFRNENNTGPVVRVLAVRVLDEDLGWMKEFGDAQPHSKYGRTLVLYFKPTVTEKIKLGSKEPFFEEKLHPYLIARYEKTSMSESRFLQVNP
jgi:hypothetical protein